MEAPARTLLEAVDDALEQMRFRCALTADMFDCVKAQVADFSDAHKQSTAFAFLTANTEPGGVAMQYAHLARRLTFWPGAAAAAPRERGAFRAGREAERSREEATFDCFEQVRLRAGMPRGAFDHALARATGGRRAEAAIAFIMSHLEWDPASADAAVAHAYGDMARELVITASGGAER